MRNFKNPFRDDAIVSVAGPASNILLSILFLIVFIIVRDLGIAGNLIMDTIWLAVVFNVFLAMFNLLPIPPLDGSHLVFDLFPNKYTAKYLNLGLYGTLILVLFIFSPLWDLFWQSISYVIGFYRMF